MRIPTIFAGRRRHLLLLLVGNSVVQALVTIGTALLVRTVFDGWLTEQSLQLSWEVALIVTGFITLALSAAGLRMRERIDAEKLGQDYALQVRKLLFKHLTELAPRTLQQRSRGGHLLRFIGDLTALRQWVSLGVARLIVAALTTVITLIALAWINTPLAALVALLLGMGAMAALISGRKMQAAVVETRRCRALLAANISEKIAVMPVVQVCGQEPRERRRLAQQGRRLSGAMIDRATQVGWLRAITEATNGLAVAGVLVLGALEVSQGRASAGSLVAALSVLGMLTPALRDLGRIHEYWSGYQVSRQKIRSFLAIPGSICDQPQAKPLPVRRGAVRLNAIRLNGAFEALQGEIQGGSRVAIVGANGAGKSTLFSLIARQLRPDSGEVLIDGYDLEGASLASIRRQIALVSPDLPLLRGTIEYNVRYRWRDAPDAEVARVCALCGVAELVAELPRGMQTRLSEGGVNLSLGQRQRIILARALLGDPKVLLLDEVDANLDASSMALLDRILAGFKGTLLLASHRAERIRKMDGLWHLGNGGIIEQGDPVVLLSRPGPTRQLFSNELRVVA